MRKLIAELFDPATRYEYELPLPSDIVRALELDARFAKLNLGLALVADGFHEMHLTGGEPDEAAEANEPDEAVE